MKFTKGELKDIIFGSSKSCELISDKIVDQGRWNTHHEVIFGTLGHFFRFDYSRGSTEYQDRGIENISTPVEVFPVETTVIVYKSKEEMKP